MAGECKSKSVVVQVPPIKIQGIKTKLVSFVKESIRGECFKTWVEPFMGSGVVGFNICPKVAIFADTNPYIIGFYNAVKAKHITPRIAREYLESEGALLAEKGEPYYYTVRERFNDLHNPLDFLFLNRADFNGMIRFNRKGKFNVPYGHKPHRFVKAYITKICNQIQAVQSKISDNEWTFICQSFEKTIALANSQSFVYCDPPYIGRHVDYYDSWDEDQEERLFYSLVKSNAKFAVSTWDHNSYRKNHYIDSLWLTSPKNRKLTMEHFYFIGGKETNRNPVVEALIVNF